MTEFTPLLLASARLADTSAVENPTASLHVKTFNGPAGLDRLLIARTFNQANGFVPGSGAICPMNDISCGLNAVFIAVIRNESSFSCTGNECAPRHQRAR